MPVIYGAGITKSMRPFTMRIANRRIGMEGSDGSISLLDFLVADGLMLVILSAVWTKAGKKGRIMTGDSMSQSV